VATRSLIHLSTSYCQLALVIWKDHVFSKVKDRLVRSLLELMTKERNGELINERVVAGVIHSFGKRTSPCSSSLFFALDVESTLALSYRPFAALVCSQTRYHKQEQAAGDLQGLLRGTVP
jgi:hypothetical protein